jgi:hypothetical protein
MISGSEWLLEVSRTILPDPQQAIGKTAASLAMRRSRRSRTACVTPGHGLARELRQFCHEPIGFLVFDIESHVVVPLYHQYKGNLPPLAISPPGAAALPQSTLIRSLALRLPKAFAQKIEASVGKARCRGKQRLTCRSAASAH